MSETRELERIEGRTTLEADEFVAPYLAAVERRSWFRGMLRLRELTLLVTVGLVAWRWPVAPGLWCGLLPLAIAFPWLAKRRPVMRAREAGGRWGSGTLTFILEPDGLTIASDSLEKFTAGAVFSGWKETDAAYLLESQGKLSVILPKRAFDGPAEAIRDVLDRWCKSQEVVPRAAAWGAEPTEPSKAETFELRWTYAAPDIERLATEYRRFPGQRAGPWMIGGMWAFVTGVVGWSVPRSAAVFAVGIMALVGVWLVRRLLRPPSMTFSGSAFELGGMFHLRLTSEWLMALNQIDQGRCRWDEVGPWFETDDDFFVYQSDLNGFRIIPKRVCSSEGLTTLREGLKTHARGRKIWWREAFRIWTIPTIMIGTGAVLLGTILEAIARLVS